MKMILMNKATIFGLLFYLLKETKNSTSLLISPDGSELPCSPNSGKTDGKKSQTIRLKKVSLQLLFDFI
jgi:hypothetical protein